MVTQSTHLSKDCYLQLESNPHRFDIRLPSSWITSACHYTRLCSVRTFSWADSSFYVCFCSNNEYILDNISRIWVPMVWKKTYIHFSSNTFPIATVITNITGEFDLFMKIHSFNDRLQTWWGHLKSPAILATILEFSERSYVVPRSCKVS